MQEHLKKTFEVYSRLSKSGKYQIAFSGGKDSHAVLGTYFAWQDHTGESLDIEVIFSDTLLEAHGLYRLIENAKKYCESKGVRFKITSPKPEGSYWYIQLGLGYPVPNYRNRWCTKELKVKPMEGTGRVNITGTHLGESRKRDKRLNTCGSSECGIDKVGNKVEPIASWRNCHVWDWLMECDGLYLYEGVISALGQIYATDTDATGSLRMGCFHCPVVKVDRISQQVTDGTLPEYANEVRAILEDLRVAPRLLAPRGKGKILGAISVDARIKAWEALQPYIPLMMIQGWISADVVTMVDQALEERRYPPTYTPEWIKEHEPKAVSWVDWSVA